MKWLNFTFVIVYIQTCLEYKGKIVSKNKPLNSMSLTSQVMNILYNKGIFVLQSFLLVLLYTICQKHLFTSYSSISHIKQSNRFIEKLRNICSGNILSSSIRLAHKP